MPPNCCQQYHFTMSEFVACILCKKEVRSRQHAVDCDDCGRWQHRLCQTGISFKDYRLAMADKLVVNFQCQDCKEMSDLDSHNIAMLIDLHDQNDFTEEHFLENPINRLEIMDTEAEIKATHINDLARASTNLQGETQIDSFNQPHRNVGNETKLIEVSLDIPELPNDEDLPIDSPLTYTVLPTGSQRGKSLLLASDGYSYTKKSEKNGIIRWRCSLRGKDTICYVNVTQSDDCFTRNREHQHPADLESNMRKKINIKAKAIANDDLFRSATCIVKDAIRETIGESTNVALKPMLDTTKRCVNRHRAKARQLQYNRS